MDSSSLRKRQKDLLITLGAAQEAVADGELPDFATATTFGGATLILPNGENLPLNRHDLDELVDSGLVRVTRFHRHGDISGTVTNAGLNLAERLNAPHVSAGPVPTPSAERVDELVLDEPGGVPVAFVSYSHDSREHKEWVRTQLAERLMAGGIRVILDQWHLKFGSDLGVFMETLSRADFVLIVCTPEYAARADNREGGVGYESTIITGELLARRPSIEPKFVPLLRAGELENSRPAYLKTTLAADLRPENPDYEMQFERLLRQLHREPEYVPPPLDSKPAFHPPEQQE